MTIFPQLGIETHIRNHLNLFTKMVLKAKKKTSALLKAEAKANTLNIKKAVLKGIHSLKKKKMHTSSAFPMVQDTVAPKTTQIFLEKHP